ncbi:enoyl-CoA hydratase/isomerase family protein [Propylenella binzhouense]|uniref:Enoyl-CoA hydratase/isomerase family protein n=1 Tax=Propylenella binzhouense TaxID=2555902 RepID=A0A964WT82_9HYPH|nr:enoyl-CoA hydratase/isomerase family protein [Propylenella binzhouense]MYZ47570.1 enoyl-CoA hydratase/isomerase family protein [Propylenella binzhouense]
MPLILEKRGHVGLLTLSRPEARNTLTEAMSSDLVDRLAQCEEDDEIRCILLTGDEAGGAFSAGADIRDPAAHKIDSAAAFIRSVPKRKRHLVATLGGFPKPAVAAVNGYAIGIAAILTLCCDLVVASEKAEWRLPQTGLGIIPAHGGSVRAAQWMGRGNAMRLALGFPIDGQEAFRMGLAQWLVPHAELMPKALEIAGRIAAQPPLATRMVKESIGTGLEMPNAELAGLADAYRFFALEGTEDKQEGHAAWRERRPPEFGGR